MLSLPKHLYRFAYTVATKRVRCFDKLSMTGSFTIVLSGYFCLTT